MIVNEFVLDCWGHPDNVYRQSNFELFIGTDLYNPQIIYTLGTLDELRVYRRALTDFFHSL